MEPQILEKQADGTWKMNVPAEESPKQVANLEAPGFLTGITNFQFMGVPVGAAAVGGALAILIDRVAIAKLDPTGKFGIWANLGAALVIKRWGSRFLGNQAADAAALILTYEAIADQVTKLVDKIAPPKAAMAQTFHQNFNQDFRQNVLHQSAGMKRDYYSKAFGG